MVLDPIPPDVQQFILKSIDSIAQLEALLLLGRDPGESWAIAAIARRLYISENDAASLLARLQAEGLVTTQEGEPLRYRCQTGSPELDEMVKRVTDIYAKHLVPVTNLIHSRPRTRVQEFADAFKLRKEKDE